MRSFLIGGIIVLCLGGFLLLRRTSVTSTRDVVKVGDVTLTADSRESVPAWLGWLAVVGGVVLVGAGMRKGA